uniref:G_PROTEIN_RECEP_F3_4 domain-containing protein n=1 Tax=Macrostomum lignano TaxID=282301 RepID=A0A1I8FPW2_9PLAT
PPDQLRLTSPELSDNNRFDYFFRVVPPDNYQAKAMVAIVRSMGWNYVTAIYDEGTYGERGFQEFKSHASQQGICINKYLVIPRNARNDSLAGIADGLLKLEKSRVVVAFCQAETLRLLFLAAGEPLDQAELLLGGQRRLGTKDRTPAGGAVPGRGGHQPAAGEAGLWQAVDSVFKHITGAEQIGMHSRYEQEGLVPMVVDAVYAMAHSLENMLHRLCPSVHPNRCRDIIQKLNGTVLRDHIRNVSFIGTSGNILRFQQERRPGVPVRDLPVPASPSWKKRFIRVRVRQNWHLGRRPSRTGQQQPSLGYPRRSCTQISLLGALRLWLQDSGAQQGGGHLLLECVPCDNKYQIVLNATLCSNCELGSVPNRFFNECQPLPVETIQLGQRVALLPMTFSFLGLVWTVFVLVVFCPVQQHSDYQGVRPRLCYVMLAGVSMSYCMTFIMLAPPTPVTCGFLRIFNGLSLSIIYSAIFTKDQPIDPKSQLILCCCLVSVQVIGDMTWLGMDLPKTKFDYPDRDHKVLLLCTLYAFKTRNIPENFNEAKYIAFTMYSTCIVWLAFIAIYFGSLRNF